MRLKTSPYVTKFEIARIIGMRLLQLSEQASSDVNDPFDQVVAEILNKKNPAIIRRPLPDGSFEDCALSDLKIDHETRKFQLRRP